MFPNVTITNNINGNMVTFQSELGDIPCPLSVDTTDNTTRSHTFNDFTTGSYYTFSVVAINSIGSGEAGVVSIGEVITTTTAPSVSMSSTTYLKCH